MLGGENMPVIGLKRPEEEQAKTREIKMVNAMLVKPSSILPKRDSSREVMDSVKRDGVQQPIIVRPHPVRESEYEVIDGYNRWYGITEVPNINNYVPGREPEILVDIRYGLTDADVFKLSNIMHKRKERNTYEQAEFFVKWIEAKAKELGKEEGALTEVAKELTTESPDSLAYSYTLNSKQSLLSQYVKVYELFKTLETLEQKYPDKFKEIDLNAIKHIGLTRLYALTKLMDNLPVLIKVVEKLLKNPNMTLDRIKELTEEHFIDRSKIPWLATIRLPPKESKELKEALYKLDDKIFYSEISNNEIIRRAIISLIREFLKNPSEYEPEVEKISRKGYEFKGLWRKRTIEEQPKIVLKEMKS